VKENATSNTQETTAQGQPASGASPDLANAREALTKLPILGPALWLYARDPLRKFTFMADIDWLLLPPVILDQCRLYTKEDIPFAFFTWARVSDTVDERLRSGVPRIAIHEWQSGDHLWLIDAVAPFGQLKEMITELHKSQFPTERISALLPDPENGNQPKVHEFAALQ
jgi:cytolysin-activating lysine-acyltransferase